jgi:hypothetical protein
VFIANRGTIKLPDKPPNNLTGAWGSLDQQATTPPPGFRNCIVVVDAQGNMVESWKHWDHLFEDGGGPHQILIGP